MVLYDSFYSLHHVILHERYIASRCSWIKWPVDPMVEKPQIAILINGLWALFQSNVVDKEQQTWRWLQLEMHQQKMHSEERSHHNDSKRQQFRKLQVVSQDVLPCALLMVNPWFWDAYSRPHKGQHPHIGQLVHHLPSSLQSISPSSSNWTWWTWGRATKRWVMLKPQAEVPLRQGSWEPDLGLWNSRHQLYAIPWTRRDCGTAQRGHIVPHHSKCVPRWFHNTFCNTPEDTEWTWVWTSHGQSPKAFCSTWRDTYTEHRVLLEPHQATDKENEWLPQRLSALVPPGVHVQRKIQWRKLFLEFCWTYFTFLSCSEHFSYFESNKAIWVK